MKSTPFRTLKLVIAYDGSRFKGWQRGNGRTVQGVLEETLLGALGAASRGAVHPGSLDRETLSVVGAGRTDAGVHAEGQVASVRVPASVDAEALFLGANAALPGDIAIRSCEEVDPRFHARYRAIAKTYRYRVVDGPVGNPFLAGYSWRVNAILDERAMEEVAAAFVGKRDFTSVTADKSKKDKVRTVHSIQVARSPLSLDMMVRGDGFLWNQVRVMAALIVAAGKRSLKPSDIVALLEARDRALAPAPAPACGLSLLSVEYGEPQQGS